MMKFLQLPLNVLNFLVQNDLRKVHSVYDADKDIPGEIGKESSGDSQADAQAKSAGVGQSISMHQPLFFCGV